VIKPKDDVQYLRTFDEENVKGEEREVQLQTWNHCCTGGEHA